MSLSPNASLWQSSAPANIMLMGEHSVVYGQPALACSLQSRITINWQARHDTQIRVESGLGHHQTDLANLTPHPNLKWVMAAIGHFKVHLKHGLTLTIESDFSATQGLGSSAAVLAALLGGLNAICQTHYDLEQLFNIGHKIILALQKRGSGTDLAASLQGGMILFQPQASIKIRPVKPLPTPFPFQLVYCGYKMPTADVLAQVAQNWHAQPELLDQLYRLMGQTTQAAYQALTQQDSNEFYRLANVYQGLMDTLGVNDATLSQLIYQARQQGFAASKISGSGLGDCILALGEGKTALFKAENLLNLTLSTEGLQVTRL